MKTTVENFGVHFLDSGVGLLAQDGPIQTALPISLHLEVTVKKPRRTHRCPHQIDLQEALEGDLPNHPLIDVMLPLPKAPGVGPIFVDDTPETLDLLITLLRLSSPGAQSPLIPLWMYKPTMVHELLQLTNIQPLIFTTFTPIHHSRMMKIIEMSKYLPRRVVFMLPQFWLQAMPERTPTDLSLADLQRLPLERMGAARLRQFMLSKGSTT